MTWRSVIEEHLLCRAGSKIWCEIASVGFTILMWAINPGGQLADYIDSCDSKPNNDWCWG